MIRIAAIIASGIFSSSFCFGQLACPLDDWPDGHAQYRVGDFYFPVLQMAGCQFTIYGHFADNSDTRITVGGREAKIVKRDQNGITVEPPPETIGKNLLAISTSHTETPAVVWFYNASLSVIKQNSSLYISIRISGLNGVQRTLNILLGTRWWSGNGLGIPILGHTVDSHFSLSGGRKLHRIDKWSAIWRRGESGAHQDVHLFVITETGDPSANNFVVNIPTHFQPAENTVPEGEPTTEELRKELGTARWIFGIEPAFDRNLEKNFAESAVRSWQIDVPIRLDAAMVRYAQLAFERRSKLIVELAAQYQGTVESSDQYARFIIRRYLFEVLQEMRWHRTLAEEVATRPHLLMASLSQEPNDPPPVGATMMKPVADFFHELTSDGFRMGWLEFESSPNGMQITEAGNIVGTTLDRIGFSVGPHHVVLYESGNEMCTYDLAILPGPNHSEKCAKTSPSLKH